jgi:(1->4)-alpha-D-glucan 1-alpha-D-glucosylmutase
LWDFSLVDPDNRRPVNFHERMQSLSESPPLAELAAEWRDGRIKQHLIRRTLAVRRALPALFESGSYVPIAVEGRAARHVLAFARQGDGATAVTIVPRLAARLAAADGALAIPASAWGDTRLRLPPGLPERDLRIADLLGAVPVALLVATPDSRTFEQVFMDRAADLVA